MKLIYTFIVHDACFTMSSLEEDEVADAIAKFCGATFDDVEQDFEEEEDEE